MKNNENIYINEIKEEKLLKNNINLKSFIVYKETTIKLKKYKIGFITRLFYNGDIVSGVEILSTISGKLVARDFKNDIDKSKNLLKRGEYGDDPNICFTTFKACFDSMKDGDGSPLDQTLCEWFPCKTAAYLMCQVAWFEGYIEESPCFRGCSFCDIIIDEKYEL